MKINSAISLSLIIAGLTIINQLKAQTRKSLVEHFTNSGCSLCAANTPVIRNYIDDNPSTVLMLSYHTAFPYNDSMYHENSAQNTQRGLYYGIQSVPSSRVDGSFFKGNLAPVVSTKIPEASAIQPRFEISVQSCKLVNGLLEARIKFTSTAANNVGEDLRAMVVVAERNVPKSAYQCCPGNNSETNYPWVVRRMLPSADGANLENTEALSFSILDFNWTIESIKNLEELRLIAFVQNYTTQTVYQSEIATPDLSTSLERIHTEPVSIIQTNDMVQFSLNSGNRIDSYSVIDMNGRMVNNGNTSGLNSINFPISDFQSGIYLIRINGNSFGKFMVP
jgi:hypothetical protein